MAGRSAGDFLDTLDAALTDRGSACVLRIDLDRFSRIADTHGSEIADHVRTVLEARMAEDAGPHRVVRLSEGSYALVLDPTRCRAEGLQETALRTMQRLSEPVDVAGRPDIAVGCNVGLACAHQFTAVEPIRLLTAAEEAVQNADRLGSRRAVVYEPSEHPSVIDHTLFADMLPAIQDDEFIVHFQPIVRLPERRIAGAEALVRWAHPRHGVLAPQAFISEAETSGLIRQIDAQVRRQSLAIAAEVFAGSDLSLTLNVSAADLDVPTLGDEVHHEVLASGFPPEQVTIEVTETALAAHWDTARANLVTMRDAGMRIAMDDFGAGHMYLDRLSSGLFDLLKIDRSLVVLPPAGTGIDTDTETRRASLLAALVDMAHAFTMAVVAEGVETEEECLRAVDAGCDYAQGYLFAPPGTHQALRQLVTR